MFALDFESLIMFLYGRKAVGRATTRAKLSYLSRVHITIAANIHHEMPSRHVLPHLVFVGNSRLFPIVS